MSFSLHVAPADLRLEATEGELAYMFLPIPAPPQTAVVGNSSRAPRTR